MNILIINYEYPPLGGGGGVAAANLAREFVRQGHDVDYVTTHYKGFSRYEVIDGVRVWREPVWGRKDLHTASIISMLIYPVVAILRGLALSRRKHFDIIHTHFAVPSGPAGLVLAKWLKLPNVLSVYGGDIYDPSKSYSPHRHVVLKQVVTCVLNHACYVIPESTDLITRIEAIYRTSTPLLRIPLGFAGIPFEPVGRPELGLSSTRLYAIAVSRLIPRKAYQDLLRAFALADCENLELLIIGDGPEEPMMRALVDQLGIASRVHFLGHLDERAKFHYLHAADFFVLSPLHEGYGIVFQEAMFCGLPIVTTNVGGQNDFLKDGENALFSSPCNPEALATAIRQMATNSDLRRTLGNNNRAAIDKHSVENVARQYIDLFKELIRHRL
jgi:glycosyltransferase involved in cell wall biosynthesis